ncbi:hypothetical protein J7L05_06130 [bacterium]|nr:hypothetical protein [bacterium]
MRFFVLLIMVAVLFGCSSNQKTDIVIDNSNKQTQERDTSISDNWSFPIEENDKSLSAIQLSSYDIFRKASIGYFKTYDNMPDSFNTLVSSGHILFWPRNLSTGNPVQILDNSNDVIVNEQNFGEVGYKRLSGSSAQFNYLYFGQDESDDQDMWRNLKYVFPSESDLESSIFIGVNTSITKILDEDEKKLLAMFGQLTDILFTNSGNFYVDNGVLPSSFIETLGPQYFVIGENFDSFAKLVDKSNVQFKWGKDDESNYVYLNINGNEYIKHCIYHGGGNNLSDMVSMFSCEFDLLDTSKPILTQENLKDLIIPEKYLISKEEIPIIE